MLMATIVNTCTGASDFNSGISLCPIPRGKIKGLIFYQRGSTSIYETDYDLSFPDTFRQRVHMDRPNRIYPVKIIEEYAQSGGEAQTSQTGYGANRVTSYSAKTDTFTINVYDMSFKANVIEAKNVMFDVFLVNEENYIFGETNAEGQFVGIPLSGIYVGGQDFDSSGQVAYMTLNIMYQDIEAHWKKESAYRVGWNILDEMRGLVEVRFNKTISGKYQLIENMSNMDITPYYGPLIASKYASIFETPPTAVSYANGLITASFTGDPKLKSPSILLSNNIRYIEQLGTITYASGGNSDYVDPNA